jgi:hypothetical protein
MIRILRAAVNYPSHEVVELISLRVNKNACLYVLHYYYIKDNTHRRSVFHEEKEATDAWDRLMKHPRSSMYSEPTNVVAGLVATEADLFAARKIYLWKAEGQETSQDFLSVPPFCASIDEIACTILYPNLSDAVRQVVSIRHEKWLGNFPSKLRVIGSLRAIFPIADGRKVERRVVCEFDALNTDSPEYIKEVAVASIVSTFKEIIGERKMGIPVFSQDILMGHFSLIVHASNLDIPRFYETKSLIDFCPRIAELASYAILPDMGEKNG